MKKSRVKSQVEEARSNLDKFEGVTRVIWPSEASVLSSHMLDLIIITTSATGFVMTGIVLGLLLR